jgi:NAD(P)-dependent dehydrogenase (short-subunit alcohol dehydrogenase family)
MSERELSLRDRVALVTGGGGDIGRAVAKMLADEGASVAVLDWDDEAARAAIDALGPGNSITVNADVRDREGVQRAIDFVVEQLGRIDIVVHSAGILKTARLLKLSEEDWDEVFDTNTKGRFLVSSAVARHMIGRGGGGVIVDIGSITAERVAPGRLHYCVSNGTSEALMRAMAVDLGPHGIRVVTVSTGPVETRMLGGRADDPERLARFIEHIPIGRIAQPEDIADAIRYLVKDGARYVTGSVLRLDGGWMAG